MITDIQASIEAIIKAGGKLPVWIHRMPARKQRAMIRAEAARCGITPVPVNCSVPL